jgi:hypothetical protein
LAYFCSGPIRRSKNLVFFGAPYGPLILSGLLQFLGVLLDKEESEEEDSDAEVGVDEHLCIPSILESTERKSN